MIPSSDLLFLDNNASQHHLFYFFFNDPATTEIYTLSLHRRSSDLPRWRFARVRSWRSSAPPVSASPRCCTCSRSEEHTSELQSRENLVCRLLLEKKK